jgi:hypothetical protein
MRATFLPGLVPGIYVLAAAKKDVDGRVKPGHDEAEARHFFIDTGHCLNYRN